MIRFLNWKSWLLGGLGLLLTICLAAAQGVNSTGNGGRHTIQGRIYLPSGQSADGPGIKIRLETLTTGDLTVIADPNGAFSFKNLTAGSYTVLVDAGQDYEIGRETVYIDDPGSSNIRGSIRMGNAPRINNVIIQLQVRPKDNGVTGVINAELARAPKEARELYFKGVEAAQKGESKKAVEYFVAAVTRHPQFPLALTELGGQYLKLAQQDKAAEVLQKAVQLAPEEFLPRHNYGFALLNQKKFAEAEDQLRQAIKKRATSATAHLYLGIALASQKKLDEAEQELQQALKLGGSEVSKAHYYLGGIYWSRRDYKRAADELEAYLKLVPNAPDAEKLRQTIADLRAKS